MSTARTELLQFLTKTPGLNDPLERKALIDFVGYPHIGIYLEWGGSQTHFAEALIDELSRRGQRFTVEFLGRMQRAPQVSTDRKSTLKDLRTKIADLPTSVWQQTFPAEPLTDQDRITRVVDLDMLATTVVSTMLLPYYELGPDKMMAKAGARATETASKVAKRVEETFAAIPFAGAGLALFKQNPQENEAEFLKGLRALLSRDEALAKSLADILTTKPAQSEAALQSMVNVSQNIRTVKGDVVGVIVGDDVLRNIGVVQDVDVVESGGVVVGAVFGSAGSEVNIGGEHHHGPTYEAGSQHADKIINAEGGVVATDGGVAAGSGGVAVGGNVSGSNIITGSDNTITDSHTEVDTGGGAYVGGDVSVSGGDFVGRDSVHHGDVITANISGSSNVAVGKDVVQHITTTSGLGGDEIAKLFEQAFAMIQQGQFDASADLDEVEGITKRIETEVVKGDDANISKIERRIRSLIEIAPDVADVVIAGLANPVTGVATAISKLAKRLQTSLRN